MSLSFLGGFSIRDDGGKGRGVPSESVVEDVGVVGLASGFELGLFFAGHFGGVR